MKYTVLSALSLILLDYQAEAAGVYDQLPQETPDLNRGPSVWDGPSSDWVEAPYTRNHEDENMQNINNNEHKTNVNESYFNEDVKNSNVERWPSHRGIGSLPSEPQTMKRFGDSMMTVDLNSDSEEEEVIPPQPPLTRETWSSEIDPESTES